MSDLQWVGDFILMGEVEERQEERAPRLACQRVGPL